MIQDKSIEQRSFWSLVDVEVGQVYVPLKTAVSVKSYRDQLLSKAIMTSKNLTDTLQMLQEHDK